MKETLVYLVKKTRVWTEITTLLIPGLNDSERELTELAEWVVGELGPDVPLHFSAFHPDYKMTDIPPTPAENNLMPEPVPVDMTITLLPGLAR